MIVQLDECKILGKVKKGAQGSGLWSPPVCGGGPVQVPILSGVHRKIPRGGPKHRRSQGWPKGPCPSNV